MSQYTKWSAWCSSPFTAIRLAAEEACKPHDYVLALHVVARSHEWDHFSSDDLLDGILQEIAGETNIVCQYTLTKDGHYHFRAGYDT